MDKKASRQEHEQGIDKIGTKKLQDTEGGTVDPCTAGACLDKAKKHKRADVLKQNQAVSEDVKMAKKDVNRTTRAASEELKSGKDATAKQGRAVDKADKQ